MVLLFFPPAASLTFMPISDQCWNNAIIHIMSCRKAWRSKITQYELGIGNQHCFGIGIFVEIVLELEL